MNIPVETPDGTGIIEKLTISDLNYLMIRVKYEDGWVNHPICDISDLLKIKKIKK